MSALLDDLKKAVTVQETTTDSAPNGLLESARCAFEEAARMSRREKYNTIVVIGRPGSGKTHFLNELLNFGLGHNHGSGLILTQAIAVERLRILSVKNNDTCWTPQLLERAQEFTSDTSAFPQLYPDVYTPSSADILPEGDMFSTTKVPVHLVYGCAVRISVVYASPQVVDRELKKLLDVLRTQRVEKLNYLDIARGGEIGSESMNSTIVGDEESLCRAFSILGLPHTQDVCALELNDIDLPKSVAQCLGRTVCCRLSESSLSESLSYVRALLQNLICGERSRWGLLDYIIVELPCQAIPRGVEVIDTPGFGTQIFNFSDHLRSVLSERHDIICICDERKLDGDLAGFLKETFFERLSAGDCERRLLNICTMTRATGDKAIHEAILQARLEEFANMVCISAHRLSFKSRASFVEQYCKVMLSQIGKRDSNEFFLQDVDFILKPNRTRLLRIELEEHRLAGIESTFISFLRDCSRVLIKTQASCVQHVLHGDDETGNWLQCQELIHKLTNLATCTTWTKSAVDWSNQPHNWTQQIFRHRIASLLPFQADSISTDTSLLSEMCKVFRDFVSENLTNIPVEVLHSLYCLKFNMVHCFYDSARFLEASSCVHDTQMFEECSVFSGYELHSEGINEQLTEQIGFQSAARQLSQKLVGYISRFDEEVKFSRVQRCGLLMRLPEFFACSTWIFYTISIHTHVLSGPLVSQRVRKPAVWIGQLGKLILALHKICQARNVPPYLCSSFSIREAALCDSIFDSHENTLSASNRFNRLHLLASSLRKVFGSSHMDFCYAAQLFCGYHHGQVPSIACFVSHLEKSESLSEALHEADFLYFIINSIRRISCECLPRFDVGDEQLESLVLLALRCTGRNKYVMPSKLTEQIVRAQRHLLKCWGPSYVNFCRAEMYYEPRFYIPKLSKRDTVIHDALQCLEREALSSECFFREWGSDILVSLYFFSQIASDGVGEYCLKVAKYVGQRWIEIHSCDSKNWSSEDVLYYNEALFALHRLGFNCSELRHEVSQNARRWNIHQYSGLEVGESLTYDGLNSLMIWSFFFRGTGMAVQGSSEEAVESMCREAVLSLDTQVEDDTLQTFKEKCYFVTHRIFTSTSWCSLKPVRGRFEIERRFLLYYLPFLQAAEDLELVGEFVQTLKCLGHTENERVIENAVEYILARRDPEKGGWGPDSYCKFDKTYHTTICALGALF